jgi:hypothetical protein
MNRRPDRFFCLVAGDCFSVAVLAASLVQISRAQEAAPPAPPAAVCNGACPTAEHPVCAGPCDPAIAHLIDRATRALASEFGGNVMFHVTMSPPAPVMPRVCIQATCGEETFDRFVAAPPVFAHPFPQVVTKFLRLDCPCDAAGECHCTGQTSCGSECAAAAASDSKCCPCAGESDAVTCTSEQGQKATLIIKRATPHAEFNHHDPLQLMHHVAELMAAKAGAEAALEVRKEADEQIGELFETLAEVIVDNAALDARIEGLTEQRALHEKLVELAAENAKLKAQVELAAAHAEAIRASHALALENERLKLRLADLEHKHAEATASAATRSTR